MAVCDFITLSLWIFLVNLFVEIISLSFKTRLGFDFRGTAIALPVLVLMDLIAIIAAFKLRNRQKVSRKLIVGLFSMVFLVKVKKIFEDGLDSIPSPFKFNENSNYWWESWLIGNTLGKTLLGNVNKKSFCFQKFVDNAQQFFAIKYTSSKLNLP